MFLIVHTTIMQNKMPADEDFRHIVAELLNQYLQFQPLYQDMVVRTIEIWQHHTS